MKKTTLILALAGCSPNSIKAVENGGYDSGPSVDTTPPTIETEPITTSQPYGQDVPISAIVTDDQSGVFIVQVWFKAETSTNWDKVALAAQGDGITYQGVIPGADVRTSGMDYYIEATDHANNTAAMPPDAPNDFYHFRVDGDL